MCDDFWGDYQWQNFMESMHRVFPDRAVVDLPESEPILHTVYDLKGIATRYRAHALFIQSGVTGEVRRMPA